MKTTKDQRKLYKDKCPVYEDEIWTYTNSNGSWARADYLSAGPFPTETRAYDEMCSVLKEMNL